MDLYTFLAFYFVSLLVGFSLHEAGHAYAANYLGDSTPKRFGRLTINPIPHLDLFGSVLLPIFLVLAQLPQIQAGQFPFIFAAAKPVPVTPENFRRPYPDFAFVAAAGPMVNIGLMLLGALAQNFVTPGTMAMVFLDVFIWVNLILAFFNLFPCPPLDGSKIIAGFLPRSIAEQIIGLDRIGFILIIGLIFIGRRSGIDPIGIWIGFWNATVRPTIEFLATLL